MDGGAAATQSNATRPRGYDYWGESPYWKRINSCTNPRKLSTPCWGGKYLTAVAEGNQPGVRKWEGVKSSFSALNDDRVVVVLNWAAKASRRLRCAITLMCVVLPQPTSKGHVSSVSLTVCRFHSLSISSWLASSHTDQSWSSTIFTFYSFGIIMVVNNWIVPSHLISDHHLNPLWREDDQHVDDHDGDNISNSPIMSPIESRIKWGEQRDTVLIFIVSTTCVTNLFIILSKQWPRHRDDLDSIRRPVKLVHPVNRNYLWFSQCSTLITRNQGFCGQGSSRTTNQQWWQR